MSNVPPDLQYTKTHEWVRRLPDGTANIVSFPSTPTPAASNYLPVPNALINEVLSHTDPPLEDAIKKYSKK